MYPLSHWRDNPLKTSPGGVGVGGGRGQGSELVFIDLNFLRNLKIDHIRQRVTLH
jgi:hypothetical protein